MSDLNLEWIKKFCKGPVKLTIDHHLFDDDDYDNLEQYLDAHGDYYKIPEVIKDGILKMDTLYMIELFPDGPFNKPLRAYGYSTYSVIHSAYEALFEHSIKGMVNKND